MNWLEVTDVELIVSTLEVSQQEKIRLLFRLGFTRSEIKNLLKVKYQIVYKAVNPDFAPKRWKKILSTLLSREREMKKVEVEEIGEFTAN